MPKSYLQKISKEKGISMDKVERLWDKAKGIAKDSGREEDYAYITGIFKNMLGEHKLDEELSPLAKFILIGGSIWLISKWLKKAERQMKKFGLKYGDDVKRTSKKDPWGRTSKQTGSLIKMDGIPKVLLDKSIGGINIVNWDIDFIKDI